MNVSLVHGSCLPASAAAHLPDMAGESYTATPSSTDAYEVRFVHIAEWKSGSALNKATANPE